MYEARQNKERASRMIGGGGRSRQRMKFEKGKTSIVQAKIFQFGRDKHKRLQKEQKKNILSNITISSKQVDKKLGKFTLTDINRMLRPTGYSATKHFLERISRPIGTPFRRICNPSAISIRILNPK